MRSRPLYSIGTVAELLNVHPETLRVWERHGLLNPTRRRGHRCYTDADVQRLLFIQHLIEKWGLNLSGVQAYIRLYPCWRNDRCPSLRRSSGPMPHAKPCWRDPDKWCASALLEPEPCGSCGGPPHDSLASAEVHATSASHAHLSDRALPDCEPGATGEPLPEEHLGEGMRPLAAALPVWRKTAGGMRE